MGGGDKDLIISDCCLEETEEYLSPIVRDPDPLNDDIFDILTDDSTLRYIGFDQQGCHSSLVYQTPSGSLYLCPDVSSQFKLVVGKIYLSWVEVYKMYETYGEMSGFGIRVNGYKKWKGEIMHRFLVCNKAGKPRGKMVDSMNPTSMAGARATCFKVIGCKALIRLRAIKGSSNYVLYEFSENQNHELISSENMDLTRRGNHLNFKDVHFVHTMSLNSEPMWGRTENNDSTIDSQPICRELATPLGVNVCYLFPELLNVVIDIKTMRHQDMYRRGDSDPPGEAAL
ncbi:hypothetical protein E3N88_06927 [Mikania micrantha]|uniref:FAR1 domain-containing protein n=1 Tax=Mikania micrantha TaxID=192012 RepID=A0A5N6PQU1_9ASTR|nr:hypothetical protein E3N88_06927 [Mikania micrantha]